MKELSIEEKAKRYDEAIEKFDVILNLDIVKESGTIFAEDVRKILPELKESDDDRIRKALIEMVHDTTGDALWVDYNVHKEECIAFLEKQGEQKPNYNNKELKDVVIAELSKYNSNDLNAPWATDSTGLQYPLYFANLGAKWQGEQKSDDKVESKFHKGDWVVCESAPKFTGFKTGDVVQISDKETLKLFLMFEDCFRLWDIIQDAKDGDVLSWDNGRYTIIFKELKDNKIIAHCSYNNHSEHFGIQGNYDTTFNSDFKFIPGTKEQRDLLFQKMKEAGYEWDAEKKELKRIEYKHIRELDNSYACVTFPFKAKVKSSGAIVTIHGGQLSLDGKEWIKYQSDKEDGYSVYEPNNLELVCEIEQKPAWSEEDERHIDTITSLLKDRKKEQSDWGIKVLNEEIAWLKSIKDRYIPQLKQKWSEDDNFMVENVRNSFGLHCGQMTPALQEQYRKFFDKVKAIKLQSNWKPSKEQIKSLYNSIPDAALYEREILTQLYVDLKKLVE